MEPVNKQESRCSCLDRRHTIDNVREKNRGPPVRRKIVRANCNQSRSAFEEGRLTISPQVSKTGFYTHLTCFSEGFMGMRTRFASQAEGTVQAMFDETGTLTLDPTRAQIVRTFGATKKA